MSAAPVEDRRPSPFLSNNPFRNRIGSSSPPINRTSTNPFLDASEVAEEPRPIQSDVYAAVTNSPEKKSMTENTRELFQTLNVEDRGHSPRRGAPPQSNGSRRPENMPPPTYASASSQGPRLNQSEEEKRRAQLRSRRGAPGELDIFADPPKTDRLKERRARRNSESSVRDKAKGESEEDKKRRERRAKEKRHGKPKLDNKKLDVIDKLDVTSIYGMGLFHHDGPFDACNPHRNRKGAKQAPLQAFPKDSRNMQLGGSGPNNTGLNLEQIHGVGAEAHVDFNEAAIAEGDADAAYVARRQMPPRSTSFNPNLRADPVHGEESAGLGTTTFLEGAPASRAVIQRRESEVEPNQMNGGGLSRTKSLAQRIRSVRQGGAGGRQPTSPEPLKSPSSPLGNGQGESNTSPFFRDYDKEYDRKGQAITLAEEQQLRPNSSGRARAPSSPKRSAFGLERKMTQEGTAGGVGGAEESSKSGGGLLGRMKSLKGRTKRSGPRDAS